MASYFLFLLIGYLATVMIELPVLWFGLAKSHTGSEKLFAGLWLTACTYPIVVLVIPQFISLDHQRPLFLVFAESFAVMAECGLLASLVARTTAERLRGCAAVVAANGLSLTVGESLYWMVT